MVTPREEFNKLSGAAINAEHRFKLKLEQDAASLSPKNAGRLKNFDAAQRQHDEARLARQDETRDARVLAQVQLIEGVMAPAPGGGNSGPSILLGEVHAFLKSAQESGKLLSEIVPQNDREHTIRLAAVRVEDYDRNQDVQHAQKQLADRREFVDKLMTLDRMSLEQPRDRLRDQFERVAKR